jgi:hypothetical protein
MHPVLQSSGRPSSRSPGSQDRRDCGPWHLQTHRDRPRGLSRGRPGSIAWPGSPRRRRCVAMNGRGAATSSTSMSNRWHAHRRRGPSDAWRSPDAHQGIGCKYGPVAVDDYSRDAYVEVPPDQCGATTAGFLNRTVAWFAQRSVRITGVLTDNRGNYRSRQFLASANASSAPPEAGAPLPPADEWQGRAVRPAALDYQPPALTLSNGCAVNNLVRNHN